MEPRRLVDEKKYEGKYVALRSFDDKTILAFGRDPKKVMGSALGTGAKEPVLVYVPKEKTYIY